MLYKSSHHDHNVEQMIASNTNWNALTSFHNNKYSDNITVYATNEYKQQQVFHSISSDETPFFPDVL